MTRSTDCGIIISIHSLHTEGDPTFCCCALFSMSFQSTPSTRRETNRLRCHRHHTPPFQSTPSTRRETVRKMPTLYDLTFQSTPSTRRETIGHSAGNCNRRISIHSLHTEGDCHACVPWILHFYFNPLPPHGGRRVSVADCIQKRFISIHSLHTEGDACLSCRLSRCRSHFNPLPPHGGRLGFFLP